MHTYIIGDTIYFLYNGQVTYGVITNINVSNVIVYTVIDSQQNSYLVDQSQAYPNAFSLVTPTPTASTTVTPSVTSTPFVTPTPTLSQTSTITYPNSFPSNTIDGWVALNGSLMITNDKYINFIRDVHSDNLMEYTKSFNVQSDRRYKFGIYYQQGTIRYGKMYLSIDQGSLYANSNIIVQETPSLLSFAFSDSGRLSIELFIPEGTVLTYMVQFYDGPNYDGSPGVDYTYRFTDTYLHGYGNNSIPLTPTPTLTPSPTPTISPSITNSQTPVYIPLTGYARTIIADFPLIYYKFDERVGTPVVIDFSGNNINGSYTNVLLQQPPIVNGDGFSAEFGSNSSSSYVVAENDNRYKTIYNDFSVEFSLLFNQTQSINSCVFTLPIGSTGNIATMMATITSSGNLLFDLQTDSGIYSLITNTPINDNHGHLFTITRTGNILLLYVDGINVDGVTLLGQNIVGTNFLYIGGFSGDSTYNYNGIIDDFSLYKYGLTENQVSNHHQFWNNSNAINVTPTPTPTVTPSTDFYKSIILNSNPIAYYRLDDSNNIIKDSVGGHDGLLNGAMLQQQPSLAPNINDYSTTNMANSYISVFDLRRDFNFSSNNFTIEFFAQIAYNQISTTPIILSKIVDQTQQSFTYVFILNFDGTASFVVYSNGIATALSTTVQVYDNVVRMFHLIRNNRTLSIYINGVLNNSITLPGTGVLDVAISNFEMFGSAYIQNSSFIGSLDEVAIYNYALNINTIQQHYNYGNIPTPTPTPTRTVTLTPTITPTQTATITPTSSVTPTISVTPSTTLTISHSPTISTTPSITSSTTPTITVTPTISVTPSITPTLSHTPTPTASITPTNTITPTQTATISTTPSITASVSITPTNTITPTPTRTITPTISVTPSNTQTISITPSQTPTRTTTPSPTPTVSVTASTPANPYAQSILNSLMNWWDNEELATSSHIDSVAQVAMIPYNISTVNGLNGTAIQINPYVSAQARLESTIAENIINYGDISFTVGAFVNLNSLLIGGAPNNILTILSRVSESKFQLELGYNTSNSTFFFSISNNGGDVYTVSSNTASSYIDNWTLVLGIYNASTKQISIVLNTTAITTSYTLGYYGVTQSFVIGNNGFYNNPWAGSIDATFICLKALSSQEISFLYNNGNGTNFSRLLANGYIVDTGQLTKYFDGSSLSSFINVGGIVDPNIGNPSPSFEYGGQTYSYNMIQTTQYFDRVEFDFILDNNANLDFYISNTVNGAGYYLKLTDVINDVCGISQCLNWTDYETVVAQTQFPAITANTWHHGIIKYNYINSQRYLTVYIDGICEIYYFPIASGDIYYGFGNELGNNSHIDNIKIYTAINQPQTTPSVTPSSTTNPTPTPSSTQTRTPTPTPSLTNSTSITPTITPSTSINPSITPSRTPTITPSKSISVTPSITITPATGCYTVNTSTLSGWNQSGASIVSTSVGDAISLGGGNYANILLPAYATTIIELYGNVKTSSILNFFITCDSLGNGYMVRADTRPGFNMIGINTCTNMTGNGNISSFSQTYTPAPTSGTWFDFRFAFSSTALTVAYNGITIFTINNPTIHGSYFGISGDLGGFNLNGGLVAEVQHCNDIFPTPTPTPTITVSPTITVTSSVTPSITPTNTITPSTTATISLTPSITKTITPTVTPTISVSKTISPTPTVTASTTVTPTITPTASISPTISLTPSVTKTITPTVTSTVTITPTSTITPTVTATISVTPSVTTSITISPSLAAPTITATITPSPTPTISVTPSITPSITTTPSPPLTPSPTPSVTISSNNASFDLRLTNISKKVLRALH